MDTGAERSCMKLDTYEKLKLNCLNTSFVPTLKGATGHDMLTKGITTFDFTINEYTPSQIHSFIVCTKMSRPIILGRDFTIPNAISVGWTRHGTKKLCTDDKLVLETEENFEGKTLHYPDPFASLPDAEQPQKYHASPIWRANSRHNPALFSSEAIQMYIANLLYTCPMTRNELSDKTCQISPSWRNMSR